MIRVPIYLAALESRMHPPVVKSKLLNRENWDQSNPRTDGCNRIEASAMGIDTPQCRSLGPGLLRSTSGVPKAGQH